MPLGTNIDITPDIALGQHYHRLLKSFQSPLTNAYFFLNTLRRSASYGKHLSLVTLTSQLILSRPVIRHITLRSPYYGFKVAQCLLICSVIHVCVPFQTVSDTDYGNFVLMLKQNRFKQNSWSMCSLRTALTAPSMATWCLCPGKVATPLMLSPVGLEQGFM